MHRIACPHWLPAVVGIALFGCLGSPEPRSCADYPPGTPGCESGGDGGASDGGPALDGAFDDSTVEPDGALDPDDGPAPDGGPGLDSAFELDRGSALDVGPDPDLDPDLGPDLGPDPGPCADDPCGPAPRDRCFDEAVLSHRDGICRPTACAPDDPTCDPVVIECTALVACELGCFFAGDDDCTAACFAAAGEDARARYEAVGACTEASGCDGGDGDLFACALAECADEVRGCLGADDYVWFRRQPGEDGYACDYPIDVAASCPEGQACDEGACVDVPASCDEIVCDARPDTGCASAFDLRTFETPGICSDESGTPTCTYAEALSQCRVGSLCSGGRCYEPDCRTMCDGRTLATCHPDGAARTVPCNRDQRCIDGWCEALPDVYGNACRQQAETVACQEAGLACGGLAAVPFCLIRGAPVMVGGACYTDQDCEPDLRCSRAGVCQTGQRGDPCIDDLDCGPLLGCRRGTCG